MVTGSIDEDVAPPAKRRHLTYSGIYAERGKPVLFPSGKRLVREADNDAGLG